MLVEDDNNLREIYEARLLAEGYEVISAKDGEEALALATKEKPDLIISDVMMPKISGFDMLDILRTTPGIEHTKVVMMTALSQAEDKARADKLGADRYLVKSQVTLEDVAKVADELLNGTPKPESSSADSGAADNTVDDNPINVAAEPPDTTDPSNQPAEQSDDPQQSTTPEPAVQANPQTTVDQPNAPTNDDAPPQPAAPAKPPQSTIAPKPLATASGPAGPAPIIPEVSDETISKPAEQETASQPQPQTPNPAQADPTTTPTPAPDNATQSTAEEEAVVNEQISDFIKKQLDNPQQPEAPNQQETVADTRPAPPETDQLNQGSGVSLPSEAPTAPTIEVKEAPGNDNNQTDNSPPPAPETNSTEPQPAPLNDPRKVNASAPNAATGGQRVIQPIGDTDEDKKPNLNKLAEEEEANQTQGPLPVSSVVSPDGNTITPANSNTAPDNKSPGNIIQPGVKNADAGDPGNIAL